MSVFDIGLVVLALLLLLPCAVLLLECLAAFWPLRASKADNPGEQPAKPSVVAVLVPAHNEELGVAATVTSLLGQIGRGDRIIVIADNCSDATAARARQAGATVIERQDKERRGKGFAIQFGLEHLDVNPPDVVVLVDADCRLSGGGLARLAQLAAATGRPVQGEYLLHAPKSASPMNVVSGLAVLIRNRVRPRGLHNLGLPCQLTGSGMAFPFLVLRHAPETGSNLVEDLVMGLEMAKQGHPPLLCPEVQVSSELPDAAPAALKQRRRWEHGQLQSLVRHGPGLIAGGLVRLSPALLGLGLDLVVPPLAMLVGSLLLACATLALLGGLGWVSWWPALLVGCGLGAVGLSVLLGWLGFGRATIPARALLAAPLYVLWKLPLYLSLLMGKKQRTWERTERANEKLDR